MWAKHIIGDFEVFFRGDQDCFYTQILGVKKVEAPAKNLEKLQIMCFSSIQKIPKARKLTPTKYQNTDKELCYKTGFL